MCQYVIDCGKRRGLRRSLWMACFMAWFLLLWLLLPLCPGGYPWQVQAAETGEEEKAGTVEAEKAGKVEQVEFFYENVCASCEGDADFFRLYEECLSAVERQQLQGRVVSYNVFLDSCEAHYKERREALGIPADAQLPVLAAGGRWTSGLDQMEELLHYAAANVVGIDESGTGGSGIDSGEANRTGTDKRETAGGESGRGEADGETRKAEEVALIRRLEAELADGGPPAVLLFTTESCEDCERAMEWLAGQQETAGGPEGRVFTCNIIQDPCVDFLKALFRAYGVEEKDQKVPALFYGGQAVTGAEAIERLQAQELWAEDGSSLLLSNLERARRTLEEEGGSAGRLNLLPLAGAGLLAGMNPCSISMLLMLLSMFVAEKASVWKNGLLYLAGKYVAYFSIGLAIYISASQLDGHLLQGAGRILDRILVVLFILMGIWYLTDAVKVFRKDYGKISTQLPQKLRRWNHRLIRKAGGYTGILRPLLILGLGMAISVGEFFCTGQIYMASITYLLGERAGGIWIYFLVYVTAMSLPAFLMLMVIQRTRNTEHISEFMLRHLGAVKIFNSLLFLGFAAYFLLR